MNKKGLLVRTWVFAFLIFSVMFALWFMASADLMTDYGKSDLIDNSYLDKYDKFNETSYQYGDMYEEMSDGSDSVWELLFGDAGLLKGLIKLVNIVFDSPSIVLDVLTSFGEDMGIPSNVMNIGKNLIIMVLMVFLIFAIVSAINRSNKI